MLAAINDYLKRYFGTPEAIGLVLFIGVCGLLIITIGKVVAPIFASIVIAYLLDWVVVQAQKIKIPRLLAVIGVFIIFIGAVVVLFFGLFPILWQQAAHFFYELPTTMTKGQALLAHLPQRFPDLVTQVQIQQWIVEFKASLAHMGQTLLSVSLATLPSVFSFLIYLVIVPLLVYLWLTDKAKIMQWCRQTFPSRSKFSRQIWQEINLQIGNYVRGKVLEIIIVGTVVYIAFLILGMKYSLLLAALSGLSVVIPLVGVILVALPVLLVALLEWGWSHDFLILAVTYGTIMVLDANVLVPILFSEAVNLHPVAIIIAVLVFGAVWGFWGMFFAIPLATVVRALWNAWPRPTNPRSVRD